MGFYVELWCDTEDCPHGSAEEGVQGNNRRSVSRDARAAGWRLIDGRWHCDGCVADLGLQVTVRKRGSRFAREIEKHAGKVVDIRTLVDRSKP